MEIYILLDSYYQLNMDLINIYIEIDKDFHNKVLDEIKDIPEKDKLGMYLEMLRALDKAKRSLPEESWELGLVLIYHCIYKNQFDGIPLTDIHHIVIKRILHDNIKSILTKEIVVKFSRVNTSQLSFDEIINCYKEFKESEIAKIITRALKRYTSRRRKSAIVIQRFYRKYLYSPDKFLNCNLGKKIEKEFKDLTLK